MDHLNPARAARGRPRTFEIDEVLDTAVATFWRHGYEQTRLEQIEVPLGLSRSSLYHQFGSKEQLFHLALERYLDRLLAAWIHPLRDGTAGLDDILLFLRRLGRQIRSSEPAPGCLLVNTMAEFGGGDPAIEGIQDRYLAELRSAFRAALDRAAREGEIAREGRSWRADLLVQAALGISLAARSGTPVAAGHRLVAATRAQVTEWRTIRPDQPKGRS